MGILQSIIRSLRSKGEDEERSGELYPLIDHYRNPLHGGSFRASLCNLSKNLWRRISNISFNPFENLWRRISNIIFFAKPRKPEPILPVVSSRSHAFWEISSSSDSSFDSSPGARYAPYSNLEWQNDYSEKEIEPHVNDNTHAPPSDHCHSNSENEVDAAWSAIRLESASGENFNYSRQADVLMDVGPSLTYRSNSENEVYANASWSADFELHGGYSNSENEVPGNDAWSSDLELQRDYSNLENEVYAIRLESAGEEDFNYTNKMDVLIDVDPSLAYQSIAQRNAFDIVDPAVIIEIKNSEPSPDDQSVIEKVEEEKVIECLVAQGKWIKHYNSYHRILLVGEGDFSFSASLAVAFGFACNIIATSLDSQDFLKKNYQRAMSNIQKLRSRGCTVMHEIDATKIASHPLLGGMTFDRVVYNFPFAGFFKNLSRKAQLKRHRRLVNQFLKNAKEMLSENGEIHISHKTNDFHVEWKLESVASSHRLRLIEAVKFKKSDYPGYNTKRGFGGNDNFNCYPSKTYKFGLKRVSSSAC